MGNARLVNTIGNVAIEGIETKEMAATEQYLATLQRQTVLQSEFQPKIYPELSCVCDNKYEIAPFYSEL